MQRFLAGEAKLTEQVPVSTIIDKLFSVVDPVNAGAAKRASELSSSVGERLRLMHMTNSEDKGRAQQIAGNLNTDGDAELEKLMWEEYLSLKSSMELGRPFNALQHYSADAAGAATAPAAGPLVVPANTPQQLAQQVWQAAMQQACRASGTR